MKFSCIIPTTGRQTLKDIALPSALNQSRKFHEIIVVYDSKPDQSTTYIEDLKYIFTGGNKGGPAARAEAYRVSTGDYIVLLDDDDQLNKNFVEELYIFIKNAPQVPSLIIPNVRVNWPEGKIPTFLASGTSGNFFPQKYTDISRLHWRPKTSSGLVLSKALLTIYPAKENVKGFNDVQICERAKELPYPIYFGSDVTVTFNQFFSFERLTSNITSRIKNVQHAMENGIIFSEDEVKKIIVATLMAEWRSRTFQHGFISGVTGLMSSLKQAELSVTDIDKKTIFRNLLLSVWLAVTRRIS